MLASQEEAERLCLGSGIPNCAGAVLKFDPRTETSKLLGDFPEGGWKWHGAAIGGDGNIYGVSNSRPARRADCALL